MTFVTIPTRGGAPMQQGAAELFQLLRDGQARTRAELVHETGLARSTVAARLDELLATGLIGPAGEGSSSGGRPPTRVGFKPSARLILAVDLGATHGIVGITNLVGEIVSSDRAELAINDGPETVLRWVITSARNQLEAAGIAVDRLAGVGIGLPGPVEHSTGRPTKPPIMPGWDAFDVPGFVQRELGVALPVLVDNDVNILALGEHATVWPSVDDLLFVKVSTGIGSGIIMGGTLQRGAQGTAGDIGHVQVPYSPDSGREAGDQRDLEAIASGPAIAAKLTAAGVPAHSAQDVVGLLAAGNAAAIEAARQAGRDIGEVLATMVNILNPSVIVIGGSIARASEQLLAGVREVVYRRSIPLATQHLGIVQARGGTTAGVRGAAIMVSQRFLAPASIDAMIRGQ